MFIARRSPLLFQAPEGRHVKNARNVTRNKNNAKAQRRNDAEEKTG